MQEGKKKKTTISFLLPLQNKLLFKLINRSQVVTDRALKLNNHKQNENIKLLQLKCFLTKFTIGFGVGKGFLWLFSFHFLGLNGHNDLSKNKEASTFGLLERNQACC